MSKFKPVYGSSEKIQELAYLEGAVYFESDSGRILVDFDNERIPFGGGGVQVLYCSALTVG